MTHNLYTSALQRSGHSSPKALAIVISACLAGGGLVYALPSLVYVVVQTEPAPRADQAPPFGTYATRYDATDQAAILLDAGRCVRLEPVDDQATELQSC